LTVGIKGRPYFLLFVVSGGCCSECLAKTEFVKEVDDFFRSSSGGMQVDLGKKLRWSFSDNRPHIGHWSKANMGANSLFFLKYITSAFL
jgi:hypothetical protein